MATRQRPSGSLRHRIMPRTSTFGPSPVAAAVTALRAKPAWQTTPSARGDEHAAITAITTIVHAAATGNGPPNPPDSTREAPSSKGRRKRRA